MDITEIVLFFTVDDALVPFSSSFCPFHVSSSSSSPCHPCGTFRQCVCSSCPSFALLRRIFCSSSFPTYPEIAFFSNQINYTLSFGGENGIASRNLHALTFIMSGMQFIAVIEIASIPIDMYPIIEDIVPTM